MGLIRYTPKSITDAKRFIKELEQVKKKGYAIDNEEYLLGVRAIASPIQIPSLPPAAIWVVGFTSSLNDQKMERVVVEIRKTIQEISDSLSPIVGSK